jgi:hypothetical protein
VARAQQGARERIARRRRIALEQRRLGCGGGGSRSAAQLQAGASLRFPEVAFQPMAVVGGGGHADDTETDELEARRLYE